MFIKIPFFEITVTFISARKARVLRDIAKHNKIVAIKNYRARYDCSLKEALDYIRSLESEEIK